MKDIDDRLFIGRSTCRINEDETILIQYWRLLRVHTNSNHGLMLPCLSKMIGADLNNSI